MERHPTLLDGCARAATAAEARFRVGYPNSSGRSSRIVALDAGAEALLGRVGERLWNGARFLSFVEAMPAAEPRLSPADAVLRGPDGSRSLLSEELGGADVAVMIATAAGGARAASLIGQACAARGIMTAGLVVSENSGVPAAVSALRPHASVLVVARDEDYVPEMLAALRA